MISRNEAGSRPSIVLLNVMVRHLPPSRASTRVTLGFGTRMSTSQLKWAFSEPLCAVKVNVDLPMFFLDFTLKNMICSPVPRSGLLCLPGSMRFQFYLRFGCSR